ncbi:MAG: hypothetical protein B6I34_00050 [Anaerolineaceae bacterium 4572_32.1]|nr:MAG: hypothetical protein B6I34_00050 [Anaerolineaceae bacterium 4572_32.1]
MAGNQRVFERAIKRAAGHSSKREWDKAIEQYKQALAEFPKDIQALSGLGLAYFNTQKLEKALAFFQQARQEGGADPAILERMADVQERLGRLVEAADTYVAMADHALQDRKIDHAIHFWKRATQLASGHAIARMNLAKAYTSQGRIERAIKEYLALAQAFQREKRPDQAMNICQQALMLDPRNAQVLDLMGTLRELLEPEKKPESVSKPLSEKDLENLSFEDEPLPASQREKGSPVEMALQQALGTLAESVFEEDLVQVATIVGQALDLQRQNLVDEAAAAYEQLLKTGIDRPEVHFNLGLLYQEKQLWDESIRRFSMVREHPDYKLGALLAVGECYRAQGKFNQALPHLIEALKLIDLKAAQPEQKDELIQSYESLANSYVRENKPEQIRRFIDSIIRFLSKDWETKVKEARQRLDGIAGEGMVMSLAEIVGVPGSEAILKSMTLIQKLTEQGKIATAFEEAYNAIRVSPFYLPLHLRLGDIFLEQGHFDKATAKFLTVARLYQVRNDIQASIGVYRRLLRSSPMNVTVRSRLIGLLVEQNNIDSALNEYLSLGETYFQLAQINKALETYNEAIRLSPRGSDERTWAVKFLRRIGDVHLQRVDWRQALDIYQRIKKIDPFDERTGLNMFDLYYKLGRPRKAIEELDTLVGHFYKKQKFQKAIATLQEAVQMQPEEEAVRFRLSQAYLSLGKKEEAVMELDALGELQLQAGHNDRAAKTIRSIIKLNPPNVDSYRQLLSRISLSHK